MFCFGISKEYHIRMQLFMCVQCEYVSMLHFYINRIYLPYHIGNIVDRNVDFPD